ncbi:MAG: long-chain fatty acid--CoA ligase [Deltaproteobacteria bacterium]|nr:long-chain fatty acid--CoA ligase [Deltaproteobacteria bacterium]
MTIPQMIRDRRNRWQGKRCMLVKQGGAYRDVLWDDFYREAELTARGLMARGLAPGDRVAILSQTRYEWAVADTATLSAAGVTVPIYPTLAAPEVAELLRRSEARVLFASDREQVEKCLPLLDREGGIELLIVFELSALAGASHPRALTLQALQAEADRTDQGVLEERLALPKDDATATIIFTSGTTGEPKGVELTHRNILSDVELSLAEFDLGPSDVCLSHLPLAHILERMAGYYLMLWCGVTIAYAEGIQQVAQNLGEVRPTVAVSVPRIFEKIHAGIQAKAVEAPPLTRRITFWALDVAARVGALEAAGRSLAPWLALQYRVADHLVYSKVRARFGGRLRFFISGGAPLAPELAMFFNAVGIRIYEGYGLTETSPVTNVNTPRYHRVGTVGRFLRGVTGKIAEDGEILVKGPNVFSAYYQNPDATREAFTDGGFFKTGDIGEIDADGYLRITDRKKDLIITAGGKNVAPQKVENILKMDKYIAEAMLYGDKKKFMTALIVPDFEWLRRYAQWKSLPHSNPEQLVEHPQVLDFYTRRLEEIQAAAHLSSYESVKKFVLLGQEFSAGQGEVTPTMKVRRKIITEHYKDRLDALYEED